MNINLVLGALDIVYTSHTVLWLEGLKVLDLWTLINSVQTAAIGVETIRSKIHNTLL